MFVQVLKQIGTALRSSRPGTMAMTENLFEVQLIGDPTGRFGAVPLKVTTHRPLEVAGDLMRDRDPRHWNVAIRALPAARIH
ncbi:hypothetical protein [Falsirhodobacter algicola]|uniref:Uncharacterized protein n=1 Tax=Falsirhodobacter algicola TaxID=2692330 RepID=A0A8J8MQU2_9RHOB|nr:hypothetical protein [Falsirhodobacter algicola]QUS34966.1 hypothetical protein GR316_00960 [Falsirhodobacter algicola]